jgi:DivIVA domain-containing protein
MAEDRRLTISSTSRLSPDEIGRRTFATARRGFEPSEVRAFLEQVARDLAAAIEREQELRELLAQAEHRAQNPVIDESTLTTALGHETARVLKSAHEAAADITSRAEAEATRMVTEAEEEAGKLQALAEQNATERAAQSEAAATEIRRRAEEDAAARLDAAHIESEANVEQARVECKAMLTEAQELRARVLGDLSRRRRVLHSQIEQLRAGRDRLAETINGVRRAVDQVTDELFRAEDEARMAAEAAGRQLAAAEREALSAAQPDSAHEALPAPEPVSSLVDITEPVPAPGPHESPPPKEQTVEELFARLRAEREGGEEGEILGPAIEGGETFPSADAVHLPPAASAGDLEAASRVEEASVSEGQAAIDAKGRHPGAEDARVEPAREAKVAEGSRVGEGGEENEAGSVIDPLLSRRDEVLQPIVATLARRLKRALTDDQNDVLDRMRASKSWTTVVLEAEDDHRGRYLVASGEQLLEAARAGASFAGAKPDEAPAVDDLAAELAAAIVVPLRRRLEGDEARDATDEAALVEHVGAAFRDWKGARIERLAGDEAISAFSRAVLSATDDDMALRWVVDDDGSQCPDCDDNALAGAVPKGEEFPTGHLHPPAHAGCRCLLAPADT